MAHCIYIVKSQIESVNTSIKIQRLLNKADDYDSIHIKFYNIHKGMIEVCLYCFDTSKRKAVIYIYKNESMYYALKDKFMIP